MVTFTSDPSIQEAKARELKSMKLALQRCPGEQVNKQKQRGREIGELRGVLI